MQWIATLAMKAILFLYLVASFVLARSSLAENPDFEKDGETSDKIEGQDISNGKLRV